MGYIYKIENKVNGKVYIGKTEQTPEQRWWEHFNDSNKDRNKNRALYRAFKKYGVGSFDFDVIGQFDNDILNKKEMYYIDKYQAFTKGYNMTLGGDGTSYVHFNKKDMQVIERLFSMGMSATFVANYIGVDQKTLRKKTSLPWEINAYINNYDDALDIVEVEYKGDISYHTVKEITNIISNKRPHVKYTSVQSSVRRVLRGERDSYAGYKMRWSQTKTFNDVYVS